MALTSLVNVGVVPNDGTGDQPRTAFQKINAALGNVISVQSYGAVGDGVTDDTVAIQAAEAVAEGIAGTVYFPAGTYICKELTINAKVRWVGQQDAELKLASGATAGQAIVRVNTNFTTTDLADVQFEGLGFNGADQQVSALAGILARRTLRLLIRNCRFRKFQGSAFPNPSYCIYASGYQGSNPASPYTWPAQPLAGFSIGTRVVNCQFSDCGASATHTAECVLFALHDGGLVEGCYATATGKLPYATGWNRRIAAVANVIEDGFDSGMRFDGTNSPFDCEGCLAVGNVIRNVVKDGIRFNGANGTVTGNSCVINTLSGISSQACVNTTFSGNTCANNLNAGIQIGTTTVATGWGVVTGVSVVGNTTYNNSGYGIVVQGTGDTGSLLATGITVSGNTSRHNSFSGIGLFDYDVTCRIVGNTCFENGQAVGGNQHGIFCEALNLTSGGAYIALNRCFDKSGSPTQGIGISITAASGKTMNINYLFFNDCSDHPNVTNYSGTAIRTKFGGEGTVNGQMIYGNYDRNVTLPLSTGVANSILHSTDVVTLMTDTGIVTLGAELITPASVSGGAGFNLPHGTAPSSPVNGDMWTTTGGLFVRINGTTKTVTLT